MVKCCYSDIYGSVMEDFVESEYLPCPECGKKGNVELLRDSRLYPMGYRLRCCECGYTVSDLKMVGAYNNEEGITRSIEVWNIESEAAKNFREFADFLDNEKDVSEG